MTQSIKIDPFGFREYDARWIYEKDINEQGITNLGKGLGTQIKQHTKNWEISRLALIDKIILYISLNELTNFPDIPTKVTINEAIDIAKKYSTAKSGRFVNGILDASLIQLEKEQKISKTGRGLIG